INGSYAEYTCVPATNVVPIQSDLSWEELAAMPESYSTAWTCLHDNLALAPSHTLVIRGASSALGQAALSIAARAVAARAGACVTATTRNSNRISFLKRLGATHVQLEGPELSRNIRSFHPEGVDAVLELVGNSTILDSLAMVRRGGRVCLAGFLGGLSPITSFNPLLQLPSGVHLSFFGSFMFGQPLFPLSEVPLQQIIDRAGSGVYQAKPAKVFRFEEIQEAHRLIESNQANGKLVILA
ncbi:MAG TPA: zinc-binding dehydrogenase, partial [Chthoniobacterales bacterium]|nr:zinc-binding dehydrogenase [Chthoniobacterales bacterium]